MQHSGATYTSRGERPLSALIPKGIGAAMAALMVAASLLLGLPIPAFADYTATSIDSTASIQTNGSMRLVEQQTMLFEEDHSAVVLRFTGLPSDAVVDIMSVRIAHMNDEGVEGEWTTLGEGSMQSAWRDVFGDKSALTAKEAAAAVAAGDQDPSRALTLPDAVWSFDPVNQALSVFYPFTGKMLVEVDAAITNVVFVYDDVAELYWDYLPANASATIEDIAVSIQLPVPEGAQVVAGDNVLAWGHGPDGIVDITSAGTIEYDVKLAEKGQYAQAHVLFPQSWLTNLPREMEVAYSGTRRDAAIAEEEVWADTWSNLRINGLAVDIAALIICIIALITATVLFMSFGRERDDADRAALRAIPLEDYDPAVIGRLMRWNHVSSDDIVATLMQLQQKGALQIEEGDEATDQSVANAPSGPSSPIATPIPASCPDLVIRTRPRSMADPDTALDRETMRMLFGTFADGYQKISLSEMLRFATDDPERFAGAIDEWQTALSDEVERLDLFDARSMKVRKAMFIGALAFGILALVFGIGTAVLPAVAFLITAICIAFLANYTVRRNRLGIVLSGKTDELLATVRISETLQGERLAPYAPYLFAMGATATPKRPSSEEDLFSKVECPTSTEKLWLAPGSGRGGKVLAPIARRLSDVIAKVYEEANA